MTAQVKSRADDHLEIAEKLCTALITGDIPALREIFHEDAKIWHNFDDITLTVEQYADRLGPFLGAFHEIDFKNSRRFATDTGFVQEHELAGTHVSGKFVSCPACLIVTIEAGKVTRLNDYIDHGPMSALLSED